MDKINFADFALEAYKKERKSVISKFELINEHSDDEQCTYKSGKNIIFAIRGTKDLKVDIATDLSLMLGKLASTKRYIKTKKALTRLIDDYPKHKLYLTGHSMGGAIAIRLLQEKKLTKFISHVYVYNPGTSLTNLKQKVMEAVVCKLVNIGPRCALKKKLTIYKTLGDFASPLSILETGNVITQSGSSHGISNFTTKEIKRIKDSNK